MSDIETGADASDNEQKGVTETVPAETADNAPGAQPDGGNSGNSADGDTFPRSYVEDLRKENADHRTKAKAAEDQADKLARRLHVALVAATNRLENADDLPYNAEHLDDGDKLTAALDALLADRPYFAKRVVKGDAGQGNRGGSDTGFSLLDIMRA